MLLLILEGYGHPIHEYYYYHNKEEYFGYSHFELTKKSYDSIMWALLISGKQKSL